MFGCRGAAIVIPFHDYYGEPARIRIKIGRAGFE